MVPACVVASGGSQSGVWSGMAGGWLAVKKGGCRVHGCRMQDAACSRRQQERRRPDAIGCSAARLRLMGTDAFMHHASSRTARRVIIIAAALILRLRLTQAVRSRSRVLQLIGVLSTGLANIIIASFFQLVISLARV